MRRKGKIQIRTESEAHSGQWCQIYDTIVRKLGTFWFCLSNIIFSAFGHFAFVFSNTFIKKAGTNQRYAQQTDAGQLTRSLLLERRAICSHGAAISDLEESELLYFQARGIDIETTKRVLVFSFGGEVIDKFPYSFVRDRFRSQIKNLLDASSN
ncbi:hypothetical protein JHK84_050617 [Glycine max]|nr:hypothetical protein JHK84_050617 [Glycine max]